MAQRISKIVLTDGGVWDSSKTYPPYTYVRHNGDGWWSTRSTTASEPAKGNADWVQATDTQEFILKLKEATTQAQAITDSATQAEQLRVEAEQARVDAENERNADETLRELAEAERLAEESKRQDAEKNRAAAEAVRDGRYNEAEENRNTVFQAAESERQTAEEARKQAEAARIQAENERDAAEQVREALTVETKSAAADAKSATEAANTAAGNATEAADKFNAAIVQETGDAQDKVISQLGVTEAINGVTNKVTELESQAETINGIHKTGTATFISTGTQTVIRGLHIKVGQEYSVTIGGTAIWDSLYLFDQNTFAQSENAKTISSKGTYTFQAKANDITELQLYLVSASSFGTIEVELIVNGELQKKLDITDFEGYLAAKQETDFSQNLSYAKVLGKTVVKSQVVNIKSDNPSSGFYNVYGVLTESELFCYQTVTIDHSKCYHIVNDNQDFGIATLVLFDSNNKVLNLVRTRYVDEYYVFSNDVHHFAISRYVNTWGNAVIEESNIEVNRGRGIIVNGHKESSAASLSSGQTLGIDVPNAMKNKTISFYAKVTTMGDITIKHEASSHYGNSKIKIDGTNVYLYPTIGDGEPTTIAHGLTINTFISVVIDVKEWWEGRITITTLGGEYTTTFNTMLESSGNVSAIIGNGNYTDAKIVFGCVDFTKNVWMFGDSYFTMWPYYTINKKHANCYLDGFAGRKSADAMISLQKALTFGYIPKTIVWFMGMNDPDTDNSVNASWKSCYDSLVSICKDNNIELVLTTIPTTPTVNNEYKNDIVKNSGYRYIDINDAVGGSSSGWYSGLLSSDNVHPTNTYSTDGLNGCVVIAARVMADLPEIMNS